MARVAALRVDAAGRVELAVEVGPRGGDALLHHLGRRLGYLVAREVDLLERDGGGAGVEEGGGQLRQLVVLEAEHLELREPAQHERQLGELVAREEDALEAVLELCTGG